MRLSAEMRKNPELSEQEVFSTFTALLRTLQKQLDKKYHGDGYLVERLLTPVDITSIQDAIKDRMPRSAQQATHRISNRLSDNPRTAGTMNTTIFTDSHNEQPPYEAMYSLVKHFGGESKRPMKPFRRPTRNGQGGQHNQRRRQIRSSWLRGVRG